MGSARQHLPWRAAPLRRLRHAASIVYAAGNVAVALSVFFAAYLARFECLMAVYIAGCTALVSGAFQVLVISNAPWGSWR